MPRAPRKHLSHSRHQPTVLVRPDQIKGDPNLVEDPQFTKLFVSTMRGEIPLALSRMNVTKITSGFYRWNSGQAEHVESTDEDGIRSLVGDIKLGRRPALYLYWSRIGSKAGEFVCTDDQNVLAAYKRLGIRRVPVRIMNPKADRLDEGAILIGSEKRPFWGSRPSPRKHYEALFNPKTVTLKEVLDEFEIRFTTAAAKVLDFDWSENREPHYHQFLRAASLRNARLLGSIRLLCGAGNVDHAFALARLLYEASINTYIDWLAPDWVGPRFQYMSIMARDRTNRSNRRPRKIEIPDVLDSPTKNFLESVEQKARLYPATEHFYRIAYPRLSSTAHQDYRALEDTEIESLLDDPQNLHREETLANWLDAICTPILLRIEDDCGAAIERAQGR